MPRYFDSHCHLHDRKFDSDREAVVERARQAGVARILTLGTNLESSRRAVAFAEATPEVFAAAGFHPSDAGDWSDDAGAALEELLAHPKVPVLGEIGLDYYWSKDSAVHAHQQLVFREQLRLARRLGKPVSIHCRESNDDVLRILEEEHGGEVGGVLHCFVGSEEQAQRGIGLGFHLGVGGVSTYKKADDVRVVLKAAGPGRLIVETDAPYLSPEPHRGKRNEPAYVAITGARLAELFGAEESEFAALLWQNTLRALRMEEPA